MRTSKASGRPGLTLIEVAMATVVLTVGTVAATRVMASLSEELAPFGPWGGLRRHLVAEEMLQAQAEGLRALRTISPVADSDRVVVAPAGTSYVLGLTLSQAPVLAAFGTDGGATRQQYYFMDVVVKHQGQAVGALTLSTLRSTIGGQHEKIGL